MGWLASPNQRNTPVKRLLIAAAVALLPLAAFAATTNFSVVFNSPASTPPVCTALGPFTVPVAAGTLVENCVSAPAGWTGSFSISGTGASSFVASGQAPNFTISVGAAPITVPGTYNLTATTLP